MTRTGGRGRDVGAFLAAVATSVGVGLAVAIGMAASSPPATDVRIAAPPAPPKPCAEAGITPESGRGGTCVSASGTVLTVAVGTKPLVLPDRRVKVISTQLVEATTYEGQLRNRARLEVRLRMENTTSKPIVANPDGAGLYLGIGDRRIQADPNADALADVLRRQRPIAADQQTEGTLRFELEGAVTQTLRETKRADLGVAGSKPDRKGVIRLPIR